MMSVFKGNFPKDDQIIAVSLSMTTCTFMEEEISRRDPWETCGDSVSVEYKSLSTTQITKLLGNQLPARDMSQEIFHSINLLFSDIQF